MFATSCCNPKPSKSIACCFVFANVFEVLHVCAFGSAHTVVGRLSHSLALPTPSNPYQNQTLRSKSRGFQSYCPSPTSWWAEKCTAWFRRQPDSLRMSKFLLHNSTQIHDELNLLKSHLTLPLSFERLFRRWDPRCGRIRTWECSEVLTARQWLSTKFATRALHVRSGGNFILHQHLFAIVKWPPDECEAPVMVKIVIRNIHPMYYIEVLKYAAPCKWI